MNRLAGFFSLLCLFLITDYAAAQVGSFPEASGTQPQETLAEYTSLAEALIEKAQKEMPSIVREAADRYEKLPEIIGQLNDDARKTGAKGVEITGNAGQGDLNAAIEKWIADKSASMDTEIGFAAGRIKTAQRALKPIAAIVDERVRKQQVIAEVIVLIADLLSERARREQMQRDLEMEKGKADKMEPSALNTPKGNRPPRYAIRQ